MDHLVGQEYEKIVLDRSDQVVKWRVLCKLSGYLPRKLKQEVRRRNITKVIHPYHYDVMFFFPRNIQQFGVVHDLFIYDGKAEKGRLFSFFWRIYQKILLKRYAGLISISKITRKELLKREGFDSAIAHNSISLDMTINEEPVGRVNGKRYILDVNRFYKYKNAETLIRTFGLLKNDIPHDLYLKGYREDAEDRRYLENIAKEVGVEDRVIFDMDYRTKGELRYLYSHTDLFVSPSKSEGFGYTPVEAIVFKAPVLVSDIEVFEEVLCGKIPTFDPNSPEDMAKKMLSIISNPPNEQERSVLSEYFLNRYSLENQIKNLVAIIS